MTFQVTKKKFVKVIKHGAVLWSASYKAWFPLFAFTEANCIEVAVHEA